MMLSNEQMERLKHVELSLLRLFLDVCERLSLRYYVIGGTLLGAVRHQGFIPWDDDIDVGMPREDYRIFLQKAPDLLPPYVFLQHIDSEPDYTLPFAKLRDSRTAFVEAALVDFDIHHGVYIDIFPLDVYPDHGDGLLFFKKKLYDLRIGAAYSLQNDPLIIRLKRAVSKILCPSLKKTVKRRERLYHSASSGSRLANLGGAWGKREIVPASWYGQGRALMFEGLSVNAPEQYEAWLTQVYGDYMQLPPPEKRHPQHEVAAFDLDIPYTQGKAKD